MALGAAQLPRARFAVGREIAGGFLGGHLDRGVFGHQIGGDRDLLADGDAWSSSALAIAIGASPRTVQRALDSLGAAGKAQPFGRGPARRWISAPTPGFPTILLLPGPLPSD